MYFVSYIGIIRNILFIFTTCTPHIYHMYTRTHTRARANTFSVSLRHEPIQ